MYGVRWVQAAAMRPHYCCVYPQLGANDPKGYFDTGNDLNGPHGDRAYVSVAAVEELARALGWEPPGTTAGFQALLAKKDGEIQRLEGEVADADRFAEAAEYTLGRFGQKVVNKPGRKKKEEVAA